MATSKEKLQIIVDAQGIAKTKAQLKAMDKATGGSGKSFIGMAGAIAGATAALYAMGKATTFAIRVGKEFEQGMANVKAISGATGGEFKALEANAKLLGRTTKFTATEIAGLQTEFSKLGFTATEINKVTKGTLALAAATGEDLANSATVAGATLRGFGLDTVETGRVTDVMAKSFSSSALDMQKFSDSMKYVAPVAKMAGFGIEGTTAMLGKLANAGIDGSMAGTALRKIFLELSNESSKLSKRLGGSVTSVDELIPALQKLNEEGISTAEMKDMVGQRAISAFSILLSGSEDVDTLAESFRNAGGSAQRMADIQLDTLEGKMTIMKSATEGLGIALFDHLAPALKGATEGLTGLISATTRWLEIPASEKLQEEQNELNILTSVLEDNWANQKIRNDLIEELNSKYGDYFSNLNLEKASLEDIKVELMFINDNMEGKIRLTAEQEKLNEAFEKSVRIRKQLIEAEKAQAGAEGTLDFLRIQFLGTGGAESLFVSTHTGMVEKLNEEYEKSILVYKNLRKELEEPIDYSGETEERSEDLSGVSEEIGPTDEQFQMALDHMREFNQESLDLNRDARLVKLEAEEEAAIEDMERLKITEEQKEQLKFSILKEFGFRGARLQEKIDKDKATANQKLNLLMLGQASAFLKQFKGGEVAAARIQQAKVVVAGIKAVQESYANAGGFPMGVLPAAMTAAFTASQVMAISKSVGELESAQFGMDSVVSEPTLILAGEKGAEHIGITPLEGPNLEGPQGGSNITLNISAPLVDDTVVDSIIPAIREAVRRGEMLVD